MLGIPRNRVVDVRQMLPAEFQELFVESQDGMWRTAHELIAGEILEATYHLYILDALKTLDGSKFAREDALRYIDESRQLVRARRNRTRSFEWLGRAEAPLARLVSHASLGDWDEERNFWGRTERLDRVSGRISKIEAPQAGTIELPGGLAAFFVPAVGKFTEVNVLVDCFVGFSYEGMRAWDVRPAGSNAPTGGQGGPR